MKVYAVKYNKIKSQQLVEFMLVVPFMIIIFGILTEYAYALSVNMNLNQGLKYVTSNIYSQIKPDMTADQINALVLKGLYDSNTGTGYLADNNVPLTAANNLQVYYTIAGENAVFIATYKYISAFTLPMVYINFLPKTFNFSAVALVPTAFLRPNNYDNITSTNLDSFLGGPKGILTDSVGSDEFVFIFNPVVRTVGGLPAVAEDLTAIPPTPAQDAILGTPMTLYTITDWNSILPNPSNPNYTYYANLDDGGIYAYDNINDKWVNTDPLTGQVAPVDSIANIVAIKNPTHIIISFATSLGTTHTAVAFKDTNSYCGQNYDILDVNSYNSAFSAESDWPYLNPPSISGSFVLIYPPGITINGVGGGNRNKDYSAHFGTRIGP